MIFGALPIAEGDVLAHSRVVNGKRWAKGRVLSAADVEAAAGEALVVARLEPGDVPEAGAAVRLGLTLAGEGVTALAPVHGRVNLAAVADGVLVYDPEAITCANGIDEALTIGTRAPFARVRAGDLVATIKVIPYAVAEDALAAAEAASPRLGVAAFRGEAAVLIQTRLSHQPDKLFAKTSEVTRARLAALGSAMHDGGDCAHDVEALAEKLRAADAPLVLVAAASATADRRDVVPAAIVAAGGEVVRVGMPVEPGNMLCFGRIGARTVIGLPGCARSPRRNGLDLVLERIAAGLDVTGADIAAMGVGGLLPDGDRPEPRPASGGTVGVIVLAAGKSSRMGGANKLLADLRGKPILAHVLSAIDAAALPSLVVAGNMDDAVAALAGARPVVRAIDYEEGLSRSLRAGVRAVPADWQAAIVCLGDMPDVSPDLLRALAGRASPSAIVVPTFDGKRGNPVLWGRDHFARLAAIEGDVGGKALLSEFDDLVSEIEADEGVLLDIDTPDALERARSR